MKLISIQPWDTNHPMPLNTAFQIEEGDDLQAYQNLAKATQLLGFLSEHFEKSTFDEQEFAKWGSLGSRLSKYS